MELGLTPSARLLAQSLLAIACGTVACDGQPDPPPSSGGAGASSGAAGTPSGFARRAGQPASGNGGRGFTCVDPQPVLVDGLPSGTQLCADGTRERASAGSCKLADLSAYPPCSMGKCAEAVCDQGPYGRASPYGKPYFVDRFQCEYSCETDAHCPASAYCVCDSVGVGRCIAGDCGSNAACPPDQSCRVGSVHGACGIGSPWLTCFGSGDQCLTAADCSVLGSREQGCRSGPAQQSTCGYVGAGGCGRPILVAHAPRLAILVRGPWG